jgi:CBS domain-containing protein
MHVVTKKERTMNAQRVTDVMTHLVVTLRPDDKIPHAAKLLLSNRISGAPVVEDGRLVGVVSEADLVRAYVPPARRGSLSAAPYPLMLLLVRGSGREAHNISVGDVMTTDVVSIGPDASVWEAASLIGRRGVRRLPVVDTDGYVVGVLTRSDLVRCMARRDEDVAADVRRAIGVLGEENFASLQVEARKGLVIVRGIADRKTTAELAIGIAAQVPGVLEVVDALDWEWDDTSVTPATTPTNVNDIRREPFIGSREVKASG